MTLESVFADAPVSPEMPEPFQSPPVSRKRRRFMGCRTSERIGCRGCYGRAVLLVDINPSPRSPRTTRIRYFRCDTCRQVEIVEVARQ